MACKHCEFKGYIISEFLTGNKNGKPEKKVGPCNKCKDIKAYSDYIKKEYCEKKEHTNNIIPFKQI